MGGTSSDVALVLDGLPSVSSDLELEYAMPIHVPMVDVHTIGAGGGSIASVDAGGMLRVGPESAGATPGPICYGRGGTRPTITDANLVLGRLDPERLLAVDRRSRCDVAAALVAAVGAPLGLDATAAAAAIVRVANDKMAGAMRMVSLSRGHDPRDFALFAFGGAGPLHAVALARELGIPTVLIPARPGLTNALGCVVADLRHDFVATVNQPLEALDDEAHRRRLRRADRRRPGALAREHVAVDASSRAPRRHAVPGPEPHPAGRGRPTGITLKELRSAFEAAYWQRFGVELPEIRPVLVNLHTAVIGKRKPRVARRDRRRHAEGDARRSAPHDAPGLVRRRLARHAGLPARAPAGRCALRRAGDRRATRLHDGGRAGERVEVDAIGNLIVRPFPVSARSAAAVHVPERPWPTFLLRCASIASRGTRCSNGRSGGGCGWPMERSKEEAAAQPRTGDMSAMATRARGRRERTHVAHRRIGT